MKPREPKPVLSFRSSLRGRSLWLEPYLQKTKDAPDQRLKKRQFQFLTTGIQIFLKRDEKESLSTFSQKRKEGRKSSLSLLSLFFSIPILVFFYTFACYDVRVRRRLQDLSLHLLIYLQGGPEMTSALLGILQIG